MTVQRWSKKCAEPADLLFILLNHFWTCLDVLVAIAVVVACQSSLNYEVAGETLSFSYKTVPRCNSTLHRASLHATTKRPITNAGFLQRQLYIWFTIFPSTTTAVQWLFVFVSLSIRGISWKVHARVAREGRRPLRLRRSLARTALARLASLVQMESLFAGYSLPIFKPCFIGSN